MNKIWQKYNHIKIMIEREIWEHKTAFMYIPLILIGFIIICQIIFILSPEMSPSLNNFYHMLTQRKHLQQTEILTNISASLFIPLDILLWIIIANYLLGCFYNERQDKSILFWQSLPMRQGDIISAKIITALVIAPAITLMYSFIYIILFQIIVSIYFWSYAGSFPDWYLQPSIFAHVFMHNFTGLSKQIYILLPLLSWFLFCSAYVKKSPALVACIPPLAIIMVDMVLDPAQVIYNFFSDTILKQLYSSIQILQSDPPLKSIFTLKYIIISVLISYILARLSINIRNNCLNHDKV